MSTYIAIHRSKRILDISAPAATGAPPVPSSSFICPSQTLPSFVTVMVNITVNETVHYTPPSVYVTQSVTVTQNVTQNVPQYFTQSVTQVVPSFSNIYVTVDRAIVSTQYLTLIQNVTLHAPQNVTQHVTQYVTQNVTQIAPSFASFYITEWVTVDRTIVNNVTFVNTVTSVNNIITIKEIEQVAEEIKKNLTVDAKTTSSYTRSKTSAHDLRVSAKYMGLLGTLLVVVPMGVILLMDVKRIFTDIRRYENIFRRDI